MLPFYNKKYYQKKFGCITQIGTLYLWYAWLSAHSYTYCQYILCVAQDNSSSSNVAQENEKLDTPGLEEIQ